MEGVLVIAVVGLALALGAALLVMRRRSDELDRVVAMERRSRDAAPGPGPRPGADEPHHEAAPDTAAAATFTPVDDLLPVGLLRIDGDHRITAANDRAQAILGASMPLAGRSVMEAFLDARLEAALDALAPGASGSFERVAGGADARQVTIRAARRRSGELVVVLEDVTELRRLQQIRTEFIDNLGHEIRTPLSTVTLLAETLAREAEAVAVPDKMRDRIARIEEETGHIAQMVNEMLDLARIEGGSLLRLDDDVDLAGLAAASADRLRLFAERNGVTLVTEAEPGLPAIRGDESRLGQVVVNLVHNAVKFSPDGGEVRVTVRRAGDDALAIDVTDHGIGIRRADRARIFERFYKADRARVRGGGTGLGLAIARHAVEGHGGRISVASEEGHGSTFTVTLPIGQRPASSAPSVAGDAGEPSSAPPSSAPQP